MAYQESTPTSVSDMLNIISAFAVGLGWTEARNNIFTSGANTRRILTLSRSGFEHVHLFGVLSNTTYNMIYVMRSLGLSTGADFSSQPNRGQYSQTNLLSNGPFVKMYLFGEGGSNPYVHAVIEHAAGRYRHFGFGELIKKGTWTGGAYCYGHSVLQQDNSSTPGTPENGNHLNPFSMNNQSYTNANYYNGGVRCNDCDSPPNNLSGVDNTFIVYNADASSKVGTGFVNQVVSVDFPYMKESMGMHLVGRSDYNQRTHLIRFSHFVSRASGYRTYIGEPAAIRGIDMTAYSAAEEFIIGSDTWKVFPLVRKGTMPIAGSNNEASGAYAIAYKKVV